MIDGKGYEQYSVSGLIPFFHYLKKMYTPVFLWPVIAFKRTFSK
ncbi:hypothetical protein BCAH1134_C0170 (plasmid) [Bacillus cereus AH1134]|nr:hypothetical protein BCAH1134_C0170 [Bacillus cereus AH1134]